MRFDGLVNMQQVEANVLASAQHMCPCLLCGRVTHNRVIYYPGPGDRPLYGTPLPGKARLIMYALCGNHAPETATFVRCEEALASQVAGEN